MHPLIKEPGGVPKNPRRLIVNAILYVVRSGCSWRQLRVDFPPWAATDSRGTSYALTERGWDYVGVLAGRITIYREPTLQVCETEEDVVDEVAVTVVHQVAHRFGIDDARLHERGWG